MAFLIKSVVSSLNSSDPNIIGSIATMSKFSTVVIFRQVFQKFKVSVTGLLRLKAKYMLTQQIFNLN